MLTIRDLIDSTGGVLINGEENLKIASYSIDSREFKKGDFFIPLIGAKNDAHDYIIKLVKSGATGFFINSKHKNFDNIIEQSIKISKEICIISVSDTTDALIEIGKYNRVKHLNIPVVAVTGSVGKTSTREIIASVLSTKYNILKTEKNYNSTYGLPFMLLKLEDQEVCVLEVGISDFKEMEILSDIIKPNIAVITNIGLSHIEYFKTQENIFIEKMKITEKMITPGKVIVSGDDKYLGSLKDNEQYEVVKYYLDDIKNVKYNDEFIEFTTKIYDDEYIVKLNQLGEHNVLNALSAIKVAEEFKIDVGSMIKGIDNYTSFSRRFEKFKLKNGAILIDDAYNASYDSIKAGLKTFNRINAIKKVVVLGDVLELGDHEIQVHTDIGKLFQDYHFDKLFLYGEKSKATYLEAKKYFDDKDICYFVDKKELIKRLKLNIKKDSATYFKASNGMGFIEIINALKDFYNKK